MLMCNQYESQSETTNKGEGPIRDKDPHEKEDYNSRGSARVITRGDKQHQDNDKQDCSKGERETESIGD